MNKIFSKGNLQNFIFSIFILLIIRFISKLLFFKGLEEESETIVTGMMIAHGQKLYSDIFQNHGALTYLPSLIIQKIYHLNFLGHRIFMMALEILSLLSIYFSPLLKNNVQKKIYVVLVATFTLAFLSRFYLHTYIYFSIAAYLVLILMSLYVLPSIDSSIRLKKRYILLGNFLLACLPFLGIVYIPFSVILFFISLRKNTYKFAVFGFIAGVFFNLLVINSIASWKGFVALHLYLNSILMPTLVPAVYPNNLYQSVLNTVKGLTGNMSGIISAFILISLLLNFFLKESLFPWKKILSIRFLLLTLAIISLIVRGDPGTASALPYYCAIITLPLLLLEEKYPENKIKNYIIYIMIIFCFTKLSLLLIHDIKKLNNTLPETSEFSELAKKMTNDNEKIISYSWRSTEYILADRLPAAAFFYYMPWQVAYQKQPVLGIQFNPCEDILKNKPKIMLIDQYMMWDKKYDWGNYGQCIQTIADNYYYKVEQKPYYIRRDMWSYYKDLNFQLK
jgi:hypothetical protein